MPQMKAKKNFFRTRVDKNTHNFVVQDSQMLAATEFSELQKNIAGGAE